jgi:hypothetical protein
VCATSSHGRIVEATRSAQFGSCTSIGGGIAKPKSKASGVSTPSSDGSSLLSKYLIPPEKA